MLGGPEPATVDVEHLDAAVKLWRRYFWPHSRAAIRQIGLTERHAQARRALNWIKARSKVQVSLMEIRREVLGQQLDAAQTEALLDSLVQSNSSTPAHCAVSGSVRS